MHVSRLFAHLLAEFGYQKLHISKISHHIIDGFRIDLAFTCIKLYWSAKAYVSDIASSTL